MKNLKELLQKVENTTNEEEKLNLVKEHYKLEQEEHDKIGEQIQKIMLHDKFPVENPQAIIDIAPPASGKTGLNDYGKSKFLDNNVVIINSDEYKPFHPKIDEIAKYFPQYYTKVTDQESNTWTSDLFDKALKEKYNVIFEGTGKNTRILDTVQAKMQDYKVIVRGMAVNDLNCLMSILERYDKQVEHKGWGRLVVMDHFYETYCKMPDTIDVIEKSGVVSSVEIYKRGDRPEKPVKIYDCVDKESGRFLTAKQAVIGGRKEDEKNAVKYFEEHRKEFQSIVKSNSVTDAEIEILNKIVNLYKASIQKKKFKMQIVNNEEILER